MAERDRADAGSGWRAPMLAQRFDIDQHVVRLGTDAWTYERKLDGLRCLAVRRGGDVQLWSRNRLPFTGRFPGVVAALRRLDAESFVMDGELVALDGNRTSFSLLQDRDSGARPILAAFDLPELLGQDTTGLLLSERKALLHQAAATAGPEIQVIDGVDGDPAELLVRACAAGWEGLIAKRVASVYIAGRSSDWRKLKCSACQELVIGGWTEPQGHRSGFGALLCGYYQDGRLRYAGKVGTGFSDEVLRHLHAELSRREWTTSPFADVVRERAVHWAEPVLVAHVGFSEWTTDGKLRHPRFLGLRDDKAATSVHREMPPPD